VLVGLYIRPVCLQALECESHSRLNRTKSVSVFSLCRACFRI